MGSREQGRLALRCPDGVVRRLTHELVLGRGVYGLPDATTLSRSHSKLFEASPSSWQVQPQGRNLLRLHRAAAAGTGRGADVVSSAGRVALHAGDRIVLCTGKKQGAARDGSGAADGTDTALQFTVERGAWAGGSSRASSVSVTSSLDSEALAIAAQAIKVQRFTNVQLEGEDGQPNRLMVEVEGEGLRLVASNGRELAHHPLAQLEGWERSADSVSLHVRLPTVPAAAAALAAPPVLVTKELRTPKAAELSACLASAVRHIAAVKLPPQFFHVRIRGAAEEAAAAAVAVGEEPSVAGGTPDNMEAMLHMAGETLKVMVHGRALHAVDYTALRDHSLSDVSRHHRHHRHHLPHRHLFCHCPRQLPTFPCTVG
jgi:hypothetical protein